MALARRLINLTFSLGQGAFGEGGADTVELSGLRVSARIMQAGGQSMGKASLQIYGMTLSKMNKLSTLGMTITLERRNLITVTAGDAERGMGAVFYGTIINAWADFHGAPDVPFHVEAQTGAIEAVKPIAPSSFKGSADVATILSGLATKMNHRFENNGVDLKLSNPYFSGTAREQALACVTAAGIEWNALENQTLAIWMPGKSRGGTVPLISPNTGMVGYPAYTSKGIMVRTLLNPSVSFGGTIEVQSSITPACGKWVVFRLDHDLDSMVPNGKWFSDIQAARPGTVVVA